MKKILLLLLLVAFALTANAQRNYQIESQLKLKTVPAGAATDSILTINADGFITQIPKSSIGSAGGITPNLAQVLQAGQEVSGNGNDVYISFTNHDINYTTYLSSFGLTCKNNISSLNIRPNRIDFYNTNGPNSYFMSASLTGNTSPVNYPSLYKFPDPFHSTYYLPISVNNNQAAVNGDITLSSITTSFTTNDGKIVTVTNGVITNVE